MEQNWTAFWARVSDAFHQALVIGIDKSSDGPDTPIIEFADRLGKTWRFYSHLPVNRTTGNVGAAVEVIYDPLHPKRAREVGRPLMKAVHLVVWYAVVAGLMVLAFLPGLISN
ncbi:MULTISPECIES: hypothetical protein [unclassified Mesorhizobium]|uniref:hypothetical protein n=1 Tax=unclassified Mesorhizobium TaxID=325217 RepID=UPI000FCB437D|nr:MULTISPECIES: hypothetical protein [unclassified Mesorhizobium]MDG4856057.1 hypothetical protein [Mesorhizobium sp. WSM4982]MDG4911759.1 hypothetical protein [Mesorhizobium sp. WSM4983]RUW01300.1 hypothetical protein EOA49_11780 [Mesorhizobium sp. M1A.F.Ca.IN.020.04.1.1]RUW05962.1 hypothetical protein EOA53_24615 [Mesorhizobium sp. M1A.F.Ca.IN.020.03.1.1]RWF72249.1 MAG: hypothetical protein EOQ34_12660 [Mesorhizobium sp.]